MRRKQFLAVFTGILVIVAVTLIFGGSVWAQSTYKTLYKFKGGKDGNSPDAGVIFDSAGNVYGTTSFGGAYGNGTIYRLTPNVDGCWKEKVLHSFTGKDGADPNNVDLIMDAQGDLYGTAMLGGKSGCNGYGCGLAFELIDQWV